MKKHLRLLIWLASFAALALLAALFSMKLRPAPELKRFDASFLELFDTVSVIDGYDESKESFAAFSQTTHDALLEYHQLYNIYQENDVHASIKTINENAGITPVQVDGRIIDLLKLGKELYRMTGGKANIAFGAVLRIWHAYREEGIDNPEGARLPPMDALRAAAEHTDIDQVIIDEAAGTVYLADPEMSLDVGAVGKGYATEQAAQIIEKSGRTNVLLSIGGNVRAVGEKPDGAPWYVGIENPDKQAAERRLFTLDIAGGQSVVTSGAYHRYYTVGGEIYHHIIDPDTLMPAAYFASVVVVAGDSGLADGLSTALFCMPLEEGMRLVQILEHVEACWILGDGSVEMTDGFRALIRE